MRKSEVIAVDLPSVFRIPSQPARKLPGHLLSSKWSKKLKQTRLPLLTPVTRNNGLMVVCLLFSVMRRTIRPKAGILGSTFLPGKHILLWIKVQMWGKWTVSEQLMWGYLLAQKRHQHLWPRPRLAAMAVLSSGSLGSQSSCHQGIITSQRSIPLSVCESLGADSEAGIRSSAISRSWLSLWDARQEKDESAAFSRGDRFS